MIKLRTVVTALAVSMIAAPAALAVDQSLPVYRPTASISGHIKSVGSDTLGHEMELWAKAFETLYPDVKIEIEATGSATAPASLLDGEIAVWSDVAPDDSRRVRGI